MLLARARGLARGGDMNFGVRKGCERPDRRVLLAAFFGAASIVMIGLSIVAKKNTADLLPQSSEELAVDHTSMKGPQKPTIVPPAENNASSSGEPNDTTDELPSRLTYTEFRGRRVFDFLTKEQLAELDDYERQRDENGNVRCHSIVEPMKELPSIPIPRSWYQSCMDAKKGGDPEKAKPVYIFVMGRPFSGTSATLGLILSAPEVTNLCQLRDEKLPECEGVKRIAPPETNTWGKKWPKDFQSDVIEQYEDLWNDRSKCIRADKSLPYSVKIEQMVDELIDRDDMRVAFAFLTRSACSKSVSDSLTKLGEYVPEYEFLLKRNIPVIHLRYEDYFANLPRVEERLNEWAGSFKVTSKLGYTEFSPEIKDIMNGKQRKAKPLSTFVAENPLHTLQRNDTVQIASEDLAALSYFGYTLRPYAA
mmetsp:Transcript_4209/g.12655  ORF Transcript_4209/g.12655 Transcript_4209/m.12655 type:complete len:421 (+) Transcript_4209:40-1302(+)